MATPPSSSDPARPGGPRRRSVLGSGTSAPKTPGPPPAGVGPGTSGPRGPLPVAGRPVPSGRAATPTGRAGAARKDGRRTRRRLVDYPRQGKHGVRRWLPSWRLVLGTTLAVLALGMGAFVGLYLTTPIPSPGDFAEAQTTTVYFADGTTPMGTFGVQNRVIVSKSEIPQHMKDAVVASEDRTFYTNPGIDVLGIARTFYENVRTGTRHGGSSITQQYAERYYSNSTINSYQGKVREAILAIKLDRQQDKDVIVSNYLNTIYFGRDSYGVQQASKAYFGVGAKDLTVSQSALLAGVVPSPNNFDPRISQTQAERRWNYVLDGMVTTGALTEAERKAEVFPETIPFSRSDTYAGPNGYLLQMVRDEITRTTPLTEQDLDQRGYSIVTTIDGGLEQQAVDAVGRMPADRPAGLRVALVTLDPKDGAILALYGGPDYLTQARNAVTQDEAQAGSTFKPFALTAYLENGGSLKSTYSGANKFPVAGFPDGVRNFSDESFGTIDVVKATADSVNSVYAQINAEVGPQKTMDAAIAAGLPESTTGLEANPSNVLGSASPHPLDMARAYNTFAAEGMRTDPFIVRSITTLAGDPVHTGGVAPSRQFAADVMADVTYAMEQVVKPGGTAGKVSKVGYPVAGKTGTSNDNKSAWFVGFTRQLTTAVAMYQVSADGKSAETITSFGGYRYVTGGSAPADLWTDYMTTAMSGRDKQDFPPPAYVGTPNVPQPIDVPNVVGETESQARTDLGAAGFTTQVVYATDPTIAAGLVISTDPSGQALPASTITLTVSSGPGQTVVPDVTGTTAAAATTALEAAGFTATETKASDPSVPAGEVIRTSPAAGTLADPGSSVTLTVSTGPAAPPSPTPTPSASLAPIPAPGPPTKP